MEPRLLGALEISWVGSWEPGGGRSRAQGLSTVSGIVRSRRWASGLLVLCSFHPMQILMGT